MTGSPLFHPMFAAVSRCVASRGRRRVTIAARGAEAVSAVFGLGYFGAGETPGVVNTTGWSLLPAVRAVLQETHRGQTGKKSAWKASQIEKAT